MPKDGFFFDPSSAPLGGEIDAGHLARFAWPDGGDPARRAGVAEEARRVVADEGRAVYVGSVCAGLTEMLFRLRGFEDGYMDLAADHAAGPGAHGTRPRDQARLVGRRSCPSWAMPSTWSARRTTSAARRRRSSRRARTASW